MATTPRIRWGALISTFEAGGWVYQVSRRTASGRAFTIRRTDSALGFTTEWWDGERWTGSAQRLRYVSMREAVEAAVGLSQG